MFNFFSVLRVPVATICILMVAGTLHAHASNSIDKIPGSMPYIVVDTKNNTVLAHNRIDDRWHPASLTKLMTAYVTFQAIKEGELTAGSPVFITPKALKAPPSRMGYAKGTQLRIDNALRILIVKSANDVAIALAQSVAGSVEAFVKRMNMEANRLGLTNSKFENPNGLHAKGQYVTARDMVKLSSAIWNEFPQYRNLFETPTIHAKERLYTSYNLLLERFEGTTGMKTGFVCASGYNIVASAERQDKRLVAVILGASSQTERAETAAKLLLHGFENSTGVELTTITKPENSISPPNLRGKLCTKKAREARYDPASENAVIKSEFLHPRKVTKEPVVVLPGDIDGKPSEAWVAQILKPKNVPAPNKRPDHQIISVDGKVLGSDELLRGSQPIPLPRPVPVQ